MLVSSLWKEGVRTRRGSCWYRETTWISSLSNSPNTHFPSFPPSGNTVSSAPPPRKSTPARSYVERGSVDAA
ncbi:hypothetical protein BDQ17DRAFT_165031 [Cyathus striatus]|nr:hypothetical protein BDQ17DRAFT_165031 [Cyathus striatus]